MTARRHAPPIAATAAAVLLLALVLGAAPEALAQTTCRVQNGPQTVEYPCAAAAPSDGGAPDAARDEPWWADDATQAILALVGLAGSAAAGVYTYHRVRLRRRTLADFVLAVERAYAQHKANPREGVPRLLELRGEVRERHERGRLEDAQFFELEKRIQQYVLRLRMSELERAFPDLPPALLAEARHRLADGVVTEEDAVHLERQATRLHVPTPTRERFGATLATWAREDAPRPTAGTEPAAATVQR